MFFSRSDTLVQKKKSLKKVVALFQKQYSTIFSIFKYSLIIPFKKKSDRHLFSAADVDRMTFIHKQLNENGLNFAGIRALLALAPCWAIRSCPESDRDQCQAYHSTTIPCWEASEKGRECRNTECRECEVYNCLSNSTDLKSVLRELIIK